MRRTITVLLSTAALAMPVANVAAAVKQAGVKTTPKKKVTTQKVTGNPFDADRWGTVTVVVTVQTTAVGGKTKVTRKYVDLGGSYTYHTGRSQYIMEQSLPYLRQEFLSAQSPNVQIVSGATYTSQAFGQSLQSALAKLK
jgi:uncharacterized protein with FMN-binding domain